MPLGLGLQIEQNQRKPTIVCNFIKLILRESHEVYKDQNKNNNFISQHILMVLSFRNIFFNFFYKICKYSRIALSPVLLLKY